MSKTKNVITLIKSTLIVSLLAIAPFAQADDVEDVMEVIHSWAELENDLEDQAKLIREDRVQITGSVRQSDQAKNLEVQISSYAARVSTQGGASKQTVRIESPLVRIYGDTAVVSFIRLVNVFPFNQLPRPQSSAWATMVLVKESNEWKIAHHHMSSIGS